MNADTFVEKKNLLGALSTAAINKFGLNYCAYSLATLLLAGWLAGIFLFPKLLVALPIGVMLTLRAFKIPQIMPAWFSRFCIFFLISYVLLLPLSQYKLYLIGGQGVDFAIFTQAIHSFAAHGHFGVSLVGTRWHDFLTHHFSPALALPGMFCLVTKLSAPSVAILLHSVATVAALAAVYRIAAICRFSAPTAAFVTILLAMHPTFRISQFWGVHDEIFAMPLLGWAFATFLTGRYATTAFLLVCTLLCKETMGLVVALMVVSFLLHLRTKKCTELKKAARWLIPTAIIGLCITMAYIFVLPHWFFEPTFDGKTRICTLSQLLETSSLGQKLSCLVLVLAPIGSLPLLSRQARIMLLPAVPLVGSIALSNFSEMWKPFNYYSVLPLYLCYCAGLIGVTSTSVIRGIFLDGRVLVALLAMALSWGTFSSPTRTLLKPLGSTAPAIELRTLIPSSAVVVANDYDVSFFYDYRQTTRLFHAQQMRVRFDFLVLRHADLEAVPRYLLSHSQLIFKNSTWLIFRRTPDPLADPLLTLWFRALN